MTIDSVEEENVIKLLQERDRKQKELDIIKNKSVHQMWIEEIDNLEKEYVKYQEVRKLKLFGDSIKDKLKTKAKAKTKPKTKATENTKAKSITKEKLKQKKLVIKSKKP